MTEMHGPSKHVESRWQRIQRSLLYGHAVDRNVKAKARLGLAALAFAGIFSIIALRLVMFATVSEGHGGRRSVVQDAVATARPDILDRNGEILATDVKTPSLFAEPRKIIDVDEAVELLTAVLPDLDANEVRERLSSKRGFVWLKREITPSQQQEIHRLGIPGVGFLTENKRVYPNGAVVSHEIGHVNIDNQGIAGIEKWLDGQGLAALHMAGLASDQLQRPVKLAVDLRVQYALRDELIAAREKYKASASAGVIADVNTGEIVAMVSEPDFDPNNPREANDPNRRHPQALRGGADLLDRQAPWALPDVLLRAPDRGDRNARDRYRDHPWFDDCAEFCELYDQNCFDPDFGSLPLEFFEPMVRRVFTETRYLGPEDE